MKLLLLFCACAALRAQPQTIDIGSRRELFGELDQRADPGAHIAFRETLVPGQDPAPLEVMARLGQASLLAVQRAEVLVEVFRQCPALRPEKLFAKQLDEFIGKAAEPAVAGGLQVAQCRLQQMHMRVLQARSLGRIFSQEAGSARMAHVLLDVRQRAKRPIAGLVRACCTMIPAHCKENEGEIIEIGGRIKNLPRPGQPAGPAAGVSKPGVSGQEGIAVFGDFGPSVEAEE